MIGKLFVMKHKKIKPDIDVMGQYDCGCLLESEKWLMNECMLLEIAY